MQSVATSAKANAKKKGSSPFRQRQIISPRSTKKRSPRVVETVIEEESPDRIMITEPNKSLKKELGIDESLDGSPHRFYDWKSDDSGIADTTSFLTI